MEDFYTSLSQNGYEMDDAARVRSSSFETGRDMHASPTFGSQEHIEQVRRTRETIAKTSFRRPGNAGGVKVGAISTMGTKFENLGKTSYSQGQTSTTRPTEKASVDQFESSIYGRKGKERASQISVSSGPGREEHSRRTSGGRTKATSQPKRNRRCVLSDATDGDSSDELNLTSSSQPIETPARPSDLVSTLKTLSPGSDSDDYEWETGINMDDKTRRTTSSIPGKSKLRPSKSRHRGDENSFSSDETPEKKKPKIKPRPAYRKGATKNSTGRSGRRRDTGSSSEPSNPSGQDLMLTRRVGSKLRHPGSYRGPIQALLDEKAKEEDTPRPKKSVGRQHTKDLEPFPMAKKWDVEGKFDSMPKGRESRLTPFPLSKNANSPRITVQDRSCNMKTMAEDTSIDSGSDDDPLLMDSNDAILLRGGLAPFPMSSQDRPSNSRKILGSSNRTNVLTDESTLRRESNERLDVSDITDLSFTRLDNCPDPKTLCPYCDMPFPPNPSPLLLDMLNRIPKYPDARPSNPLGLKAPLLSYVSMCQRHEFEMQLLPTAQAAGWPTRIDFTILPERVRAFRQRLARVTHKKEMNIFWRELKEDIDKQGVKKTMGIMNQFNSFENCQPGYYGEQGAVIIFQTLCHLFPPDCIDADLLAPLTHRDFLRCVLVPECAVGLIQEDLGRGTNREYAIRTLRESSKYGTAMFPDLDNCDGMSLTMGEKGCHRVDETLIKEQARVKRLQTVEERSTEIANELEGRDAIPSRHPNSGRISQRDRGNAEEPRRRAVVGKPKEKIKCDKKGNAGLIELSDSSPARTRASSRKHLRKTAGKETDLSDSSARSKSSEVSSKRHQISRRTGRDPTAKPQAGPATRPKTDLLAILMNSDAFPSDSDEDTPRPPDRFRRDPYESDLGIVLPEENNRYEGPSRRNGVSSSSTTKINATFQPLQAAKDRKKTKEVVFRKTMWENDEESETGESDNFSGRSDTKLGARPKCEKNSLAKTNSHSWLWSDPTTPSATPSN